MWNPAFLALHDAVSTWLLGRRRFALQEPGEDQRGYEAHAWIYDAVRRRDSDGAEAAMQQNLEEGWVAFWHKYKPNPSCLSLLTTFDERRLTLNHRTKPAGPVPARMRRSSKVRFGFPPETVISDSNTVPRIPVFIRRSTRAAASSPFSSQMCTETLWICLVAGRKYGSRSPVEREHAAAALTRIVSRGSSATPAASTTADVVRRS